MLEDYWENFGILLSLFFIIPIGFIIIFLLLIFMIICFPLRVGYILIKEIDKLEED